MISDQVKRFNLQTRESFHVAFNYALVLIGFALLGLIAGSLVSLFLGLIGVLFQITKVFLLFFKAVFCRYGIKDDEDDDLTSPSKSPMNQNPTFHSSESGGF